MKKILDSDWLKEEYSFRVTWMQNYVTKVESCNTSANYKVILISLRTIEIIQTQSD